MSPIQKKFRQLTSIRTNYEIIVEDNRPTCLLWKVKEQFATRNIGQGPTSVTFKRVASYHAFCQHLQWRMDTPSIAK